MTEEKYCSSKIILEDEDIVCAGMKVSEVCWQQQDCCSVANCGEQDKYIQI